MLRASTRCSVRRSTAHRASIGLAPVDDVRDYVRDDVIGTRPWLATDPILDPWQATPDLDVVQTGAWILPDERPLPADLEAFLDAGAPPVYVGFGSMPMGESPDVAKRGHRGDPGAGPPRGGGSRLGRPGPDRRRGRLHRRRRGQPAGTVRQGGRRRAPRRRGHHDDGGHGRRTSSGGTAGGRPAILGGTGWPSWASVRRTTVRHRRRVPVGRARDGAMRQRPARGASAVAATIRTDGATVAAKLLLERRA